MRKKDDVKSYIDKQTVPLIGRICYYLFPYRKQTIQSNMQRVFADTLSKKQINKLCCLFYAHLIQSVVDAFKPAFLSKNHIKSLGKVTNIHYMEQAIAQQKGVIFLTGHFGSWELGILACRHYVSNAESAIIRKHIRTQWIEKFLFANCQKFNITVLKKNKYTLVKAYKHLKKKQVLTIVFDQRSGLHNDDGMLIDFFGHPCLTANYLAELVQRTGSIVVPCYLQRQKNGQHLLSFESPLSWQTDPDKQQEIYQNSKIYNQCLEKMLLRRPEQWLWSHKRWRQ